MSNVKKSNSWTMEEVREKLDMKTFRYNNMVNLFLVLENSDFMNRKYLLMRIILSSFTEGMNLLINEGFHHVHSENKNLYLHIRHN